MPFFIKIAPGVRFLQSLLLFTGILFLACSNSRNIKGNTSAGDTSTTAIAGRWVVSSQFKSALAVVPSCKPIQEGTVFTFTATTLEIYLADSKTPCDVFGIRVSPSAVSLIKDDMVWLCNYTVKGNTLTLTSNSLFTINQNETKPSPTNETATSGEVVVTLIKN
jgi:hypothetical protein